MSKQYKKIDENTIEEINTNKVDRTLHDIKILKENLDYFKRKIKKIEEILKAVGEL